MHDFGPVSVLLVALAFFAAALTPAMPAEADFILKTAGLSSLVAPAVSVAVDRRRDHARFALYGSLVGAIGTTLVLLILALLRLI
jgi:hypothetical protein